MEEKPMTKTEAREWLKRVREGVRWAEDALKSGDAQDLVNAVNDISGAACMIETALNDDYIGQGIKGMEFRNE
jgi:hypothetical protein